MTRLQSTVLIVEDDVASRRAYDKFLSMEDFLVLHADNGRDALDVLERERCPDLVMMDLSMPTMSGDELIRALRAHAKCSQVKVLIISGRSDLAAHAKDVGADGYLRKPVDLHHLHREVARLIRQPPPRETLS